MTDTPTVPQWLQQTTLSFEYIAKECGVHVSQVYRWRDGKTDPRGRAAFKLFELSGHTIQYPERKRRRRSAA